MSAGLCFKLFYTSCQLEELSWGNQQLMGSMKGYHIDVMVCIPAVSSEVFESS